MECDDPLPDEIIARWERWRTELPLLEKVKLNCVKPPGFGRPFQAEVHSFSDPSESGIGQVSYLRTVNSNGEVHVSFPRDYKGDREGIPNIYTLFHW